MLEPGRVLTIVRGLRIPEDHRSMGRLTCRVLEEDGGTKMSLIAMRDLSMDVDWKSK